MKTILQPTAAELRAFGLGESDLDTSQRVAEYLLVSGDTQAMDFVSAFNRARLRVEAYQAEGMAATRSDQWSKYLDNLVSHVTKWVQAGILERLSASLVPATLGERSVQISMHTVHFQLNVPPAWLYVFSIAPDGAMTLVHAPTPSEGLLLTTPQVSLPEDSVLALGIATSVPLDFSELGEQESMLTAALKKACLGEEEIRIQWLELTDKEYSHERG